MGKLSRAHLIETALWIALACLGFYYSSEFNQPIEIYEFGASGWPRGILAFVVVAALGNLYWHFRFGDDDRGEHHPEPDVGPDTGPDTGEAEPGVSSSRIATSMELPGSQQTGALQDTAATQLGLEVPQDLPETKLSYYARILPIIGLPFLYAYFLEGVGFYSLTPPFIALVIYAMGERNIAWLFGVTALIYGLLLFLFAKVLFVGLPVGIWHPFYDYSQWLITVLQNSYLLEFLGLAVLLPITLFSITMAKGAESVAFAVKKAAIIYAAMFATGSIAAYLLGGKSQALILFDVLKWPLSLIA